MFTRHHNKTAADFLEGLISMKEIISATLEGKEEATPPARARNVPKIIYGKDMMELLNHKGKVNISFGSHYHHMVSHCHQAKKYPK